MEISNLETVALMFKALGDPTRLRIFQILSACAPAVEVHESGECQPAGGHLTVGEVCCQLGGSASTISHHLRELRLAGLIRTEKRGRSILCTLRPEAVHLLAEFIQAPCCAGTD